MSQFIKRKIFSEYQSIGDELRLSREELGLTIFQVSKKVGLDQKILMALEMEDYQNVPTGIYGKIAFKKYVEFLGLNYRKVFKYFLKHRKPGANNVFFNKVVEKKDMVVVPRLIGSILLAIVIISCFLYLSFYLRRVFSAPDLEIIFPTPNLVVKELTMDISGKTDPESEVFINDELILADQNGVFLKAVVLKQGVNDIIIKAKKKYGKEQIESRQVLVE